MKPTAEAPLVDFPAKLRFLLQPHKHDGPCGKLPNGQPCGRYKVPYGGRGGLKSYGAADASLLRGIQQHERIFCARETMDSIDESVRFLLEQRAGSLGIGRAYEFQKYSILGLTDWLQCPSCGGSDLTPKRRCKPCDVQANEIGRSEFIFAGVRSDPGKVKSMEGATITWLEEAAAIADGTWDIIIPTMRWQDTLTGRKAEIWATYNPRFATDATHKRFALNPPPSAIVCRTDYRDNPWFPDVLRADMEQDKISGLTPEEIAAGVVSAKYRHIWLGECATTLEGAIFAAELKQADEDKRISDVPIDRTKPVHTFWDLGFGDFTAVWFAQAYDGWYNVIDYEEDNGKTVADWIVRLQQKGYMYGEDWLPHDGVDAQLHHRMTGDKTRSVEQLMRAAGRKVRVAPKMAVHDRLNAARTIFAQCRFDVGRCEDGVQRLRHYQWGPPSALGVARREPLHDAASHGADAFCTLAVSIKQPAAPVRRAVTAPEGDYSWMA